LVNDERWAVYLRKQEQKQRVRQLLETRRLEASLLPDRVLAPDDRPTLAEWLRRPEARIQQLQAAWAGDLADAGELARGVLDSVETEFKYAGYIAQQQRQVERLRDSDRRRIPAHFVYTSIPGLSNEVQQRLTRVRPETLGQASRIPGVTPAAVAVLDVYLRLDA
jgi:tRNA uridine 5-carboxymethylaminomethyl modification enzyme